MRITIVTQPQLKHQVAPHDAMAEGMRKHGLDVARVTEGEPVPECDAVVCWGWRIGKRLSEQGRDVLVMERGYVGDRRFWTSCGWNGLNGNATFPDVTDGKRWETLFASKLLPWRYTDGYVLLVGQVPGDSSIDNNHVQWLRETYDEIEAMGEQVVFRPHPMANKTNYGDFAVTSVNSLNDDLAGAKCVVTYNSNTGVDAVLAGVPVVAMDKGSMAWPVSGHELGDIEMPERVRWANRLAYAQWSEDEIRAGEAWESLEAVRPS